MTREKTRTESDSVLDECTRCAPRSYDETVLDIAMQLARRWQLTIIVDPTMNGNELTVIWGGALPGVYVGSAAGKRSIKP